MLKWFTWALSNPEDPLTKCFQRINDNSATVIALNEKVKTFEDRVKAVEDKLYTKDLEIAELRIDLTKAVSTIESLTEKVEKIESDHCSERIDELDQYGRRSIIRISGIDESQLDTTKAALDLFNNTLWVDVQPSDIDTSHRVGRIKIRIPDDEADDAGEDEDTAPKKPASRAIVVKFKSTAKRYEVMGKRRKLKGQGVFLAEHLTPTRARLYNLARMYRKSNFVDNAFTSDGKIFVIDKAGNKHRVVSPTYLLQFGILPEKFRPAFINAWAIMQLIAPAGVLITGWCVVFYSFVMFVDNRWHLNH